MPRRLPTRRFVVTAGLAAGGGLVLGFGLGDVAAERKNKRRARKKQSPPARHRINAWIIIRPDEKIIVRIARSELGQGTLTGLAQLVAEELDCNWQRVEAELVQPNEDLVNGQPTWDFSTGSSRSIRAEHARARRAGQAARLMLLQAASEAWKVSADEFTTDAGVITHPASRRRTTYDRLAEAAAALPPPDTSSLPLKDVAAWRIAGKPLARLDTPAKVTGTAVYGIDVRLPGMLNAAIRAAPVPGGRLADFDATRALTMSGVRHVLRVGDNAVAVVADSWWQAQRALDTVNIRWAPVEESGIDSRSIDAFLKTGLKTDAAFVGRTHGDALAALRGSTTTLEAVYDTPFLHHATLEPMNATARWQTDSVEVWAPTQNADAAMRTAAAAAGMDAFQVRIHRTMVGGSFGRRLKHDCIRQAVLIAREIPGVPVKLIWSREEDTTHGYYRPVTQAKLNGGLDDKGQATGLIYRVSGQSILASNLGRRSSSAAGRDPRMFQGLFAEPGEAQMGYSIPNVYIDHAMRNTHVPVGSWRGVHTTQNGFYLESFVDELAHTARRDPLDFRRDLMRGHPRHLAVLEAVADRAGWRAAPPPGTHRGLAQVMSVGSYAAVVVEVTMRGDNQVRVERVVVALDCGVVVNPRLVTAQVEGAVAMGLSAALLEEITIREGHVVERNFDTYPVLRLADYPKVEVELVPSVDTWGGVGDAVIGAVAPALLNAVFSATGKRVRTLPLRKTPLG